MSDAVLLSPIGIKTEAARFRCWAWIATWCVLIALATAFFLRNGLHYFLDQSRASFGRYAPYRFALLFHITGGVVALFTAPLQFWIGYRRKPMHVHRWVGRVFLAGVAIGSIGAMSLAVTVTMRNWAFAFGLLMLAAAWVSTSTMAYVAIRNRMIELHKEWMIRAYVVTFAFVTFRIFSSSALATMVARRDLATTLAWASWVIPLFVTELVLQVRRMRNTQRQRLTRAAVPAE